MARDDPTLYLRIPTELKEALDAAAAVNRRSLTSEVVARLSASFPTGPSMVARLATSNPPEVAENHVGAAQIEPAPLRMVDYLRRQEALRDQLAAKLASAQARVAQLQYLVYSGPADGLTGEEMDRLRAELNEANVEAKEIRDQLDSVVGVIDKTGAW